MKHRLVLADRGEVHVHRWRPVCSCGGWSGSNHRRKQEAARQYRAHVNGLASAGGRRAAGTVIGPQVCTPTADLPDALRPVDVTRRPR